MGEGAGADGEEDAVTVHAGGGAVVVDGVHEGRADEVEGAADDVPGEVVARGTHDGAVGKTHDDEDDDEGQETHAGVESGVVADELEEEGDEVDGEESGGGGTCRFGEEHDHDFAFQELDGEDAALFGREDGHALLDAKEDE